MSLRRQFGGAWLAALCVWSGSHALGNDPPGCPLEIRIEAEGARSPALEIYVAVVADDQPWQQPAAEALQALGAPLPRWRLPPGRYRVVCSLAGFAPLFTTPFEAPAEAAEPRRLIEIRCPLQPLAYRSGQVVAARGEPITGARLVPLHLAMAESPVALSQLGTAHLRRNLEAVTDGAGGFRIGGPSGSRVSLWVEAPGFAPRLLADVAIDAQAVALPPLHLERGGGLSVEAALAGGLDRGRYLIGLRQIGIVTSSDRATVEAALHAWLRPLPETGDFHGAWGSLPAGAYEVWLKERAPGASGRPPITLGRAEVAVGAPTTTLRIDLAGSQLASDEGAARPLRLLVRAGDVPTTGEARAERWMGMEPKAVPIVPEPASGGLALSIPSGCHEDWLYTVRLGDQVSAAVPAEGCAEPARPVALFPAAELRGRIRQPVGTPRPAQMEFAARRCAELPGGPELGVGRFPIALERDGRWRSAVPAGCVHLRFEASGFAPVAFASLGLGRGGSRDLGTVELAPGGSLLARIVDSETGRAASAIAAVLLSASGLPEGVEAMLAGRSPVAEAEASVDEQGWLQLRGVKPGSYSLVASGAGGRLLVSPLFAVAAGEELLLPDLELPAPATALLSVAAGSEALPEGATLELAASYLPAGCRWAPVPRFRQALKVGEPLDLSGLPPGHWRFEAVLLPSGGGRYTAGKVETDLAPASFTALELPLGGRLYRGVVRFRGSPLAASVKLRPWAAGAAQAQAQSDREGRFTVLLSQPGVYQASVWAGESALGVTVPRVLFDDPDEEVELRLPEGAVSGVVVDHEDRSMAEVWVFADGIESLLSGEEARPSLSSLGASARTDAAGHFELVGLAAGDWELRATLGRNRPASRKLDVKLGEDEVVPGLRLVIEEGRTLTLEARLGGRPAAGVLGSALFVAADGSVLGQVAGFSTDLEGKYRFEAPPGEIVYVLLHFQPASAPVTAFRLPFAAELVVELPPLGGNVELTLPPRELLGVDPSLLVLLHENGASIPLGRLRTASEKPAADGSGIVGLPALAPGRWRLVALDAATDWQYLAAGHAAGRVIESFDLVPGGQVHLALPARAAGPGHGE